MFGYLIVMFQGCICGCGDMCLVMLWSVCRPIFAVFPSSPNFYPLACHSPLVQQKVMIILRVNMLCVYVYYVCVCVVQYGVLCVLFKPAWTTFKVEFRHVSNWRCLNLVKRHKKIVERRQNDLYIYLSSVHTMQT